MVNQGFRQGETKYRVVPRSLALAPDRGGSFLFLANKKGGGSVESDLGELDLLNLSGNAEANGTVSINNQILMA